MTFGLLLPVSYQFQISFYRKIDHSCLTVITWFFKVKKIVSLDVESDSPLINMSLRKKILAMVVFNSVFYPRVLNTLK